MKPWQQKKIERKRKTPTNDIQQVRLYNFERLSRHSCFQSCLQSFFRCSVNVPQIHAQFQCIPQFETIIMKIW